jgi:outer membrane protein assembly factor BamB
VNWKFDMMEEVGSSAAQHVELVAGDLRRSAVSSAPPTARTRATSTFPRRAPAIIALNKKTGKKVWEDNPGTQDSARAVVVAAVGKIGDVVQVVIGQGDGWVRGYEAMTGKKLWEFDMNPKDSVWPKTRNEVIRRR